MAIVVGMDWPAIQVLIPPDADRERLLALLRAYESGMLSGIAKKAKKDQPGE